MPGTFSAATRAACFFVAAVLAFAALVALMAIGLLPSSYPHWLILTALSAIAAPRLLVITVSSCRRTSALATSSGVPSSMPATDSGID